MKPTTLTEKYRPRSLAEIRGQSHVVTVVPVVPSPVVEKSVPVKSFAPTLPGGVKLPAATGELGQKPCARQSRRARGDGRQ